jgi:hypothetical protein
MHSSVSRLAPQPTGTSLAVTGAERLSDVA